MTAALDAGVTTRGSLRLELGALGIAAAGVVVAIAVLLTTPRGGMILYNGDSVLLELIRRSLAAGGPQDWSMSPVLFLFPELPSYLALHSVLPTTQATVIVTAFLTLIGFYLLLRSIAGQLSSDRRHAPLVSLAAFAVVVLCLLTEHTDNRESFELVSLLLIPTYYYGVVLAGFGSISLTLVIIRRLNGRAPRAWPAVVALGIIALVTTASDPVFVIWVAAPLLTALVVGALVRWTPWRALVLTGVPVLLGVTAGFTLRIPFARYFSPSTSFFHPGEQLHAAFYYPKRIANMIVDRGLGLVEVGILFSLIAVAVLVFLMVRRVPERPERMLLVLLGLVAPILSYAVPVAAGTYASRYLQPVYLAPLLSVMVVVCLVLDRHPVTRAPAAIRAPSRGVLAVITAVVVVALGASLVSIVPVLRGDDSRPACLASWIDGRNLTGAGQFWETRDLLAYGDPSIRLVQVVPTLTLFPWLVNIAPAYDARVTYVVSEKRSWLKQVADQIGRPASVTVCPGYSIADYAGTPGEKLLTDAVNQSARAIGRQQGFLPSPAP